MSSFPLLLLIAPALLLSPACAHGPRGACVFLPLLFWVSVVSGNELLTRGCFPVCSSIDLDLPTEVDDEYWENDDPELAFRQPEGKPALVASFNQWIKLSHIIAYALKTLVSYLAVHWLDSAHG